MQVGFNFFQPKNNFINAGAINNNIAKGNAVTGSAKNAQRRDRFNLSPQGKMMQTIENLVNQKKAISEQRGELISRTLEEGKELKTIEYQLDSYEEQLSGIDKQIKQLTTEMAKSVTIAPEEKKKKSSKSEENKTEEEARIENLSTIASTADSVKNAETVSSVKEKLEGEVKVKETENNNTQIMIDHIESRQKIDGSNVKNVVTTLNNHIESKSAEILELEQQMASMESNRLVNLGDATEKLEESSEEVAKSDGEREIKE